MNVKHFLAQVTADNLLRFYISWLRFFTFVIIKTHISYVHVATIWPFQPPQRLRKAHRAYKVIVFFQRLSAEALPKIGFHIHIIAMNI